MANTNTGQRGKAFLLKFGDEALGSPTTFTTLAGLRGTTFTFNGEDVDANTKDDDGWQQRVQGAGIRSISISADGVYQDAAVDDLIMDAAFAQDINRWQITSLNGDILEFSAQVSSYERAGPHDNIETFSISLSSHGNPGVTRG